MSSDYHSLLTSYIVSSHSSTTGNLSLPHILGSCTPSKVIVFSWHLVLDMLFSREILFKRNVIVDLVLTIFHICGVFVESTSHSFVTCDFVSNA